MTEKNQYVFHLDQFKKFVKPFMDKNNNGMSDETKLVALTRFQQVINSSVSYYHEHALNRLMVEIQQEINRLQSKVYAEREKKHLTSLNARKTSTPKKKTTPKRK